jgi:hypothetical protein
MTSVQEARKKELARSLVENAKQVEANRQRQRRMQEEAQRQQEEDEVERAWRDFLHRQAIQEEVSKKMEKERLDQEQIENAKKTLTDKLKTAAALAQQKQRQYFISYNTAPDELDSQCENFAKEWMNDLAKVKDPEMREKLLSKAGELMREKYKKDIEERLEKQASESGMPYFSPF